jgi:hypothetical protein
MKASLWAIIGITAAGAGGSGYVLMPAKSATSAPAAAREVAAVQQPANGQSAFATADLSRAPITAPMHGDPFGNWTAAPKASPTPAAAAPVRPVIPAFPYSYAGTLTKGHENAEAFLLRGGKELVPVKAGAVLDGTWRVEALTGDRIEVTYLPAGERVSMLLANLTGDRNAPLAAIAASSSATSAYDETGVRSASIEPAPAAVRPAPIAVANNAQSGGLAVQPMAAASSSAPRALANAGPAAVSGGSAVGSQAPANSAPLGSEAPTQGSMPTGPAPSGDFPKGDTPTGKLGH